MVGTQKTASSSFLSCATQPASREVDWSVGRSVGQSIGWSVDPPPSWMPPRMSIRVQGMLAVDMLMGMVVVVAVALVLAVVVVSFGMFCTHRDSSIFVMTGLS